MAEHVDTFARSQTIARLRNTLKRISEYSDNPTAWQRLEPNDQGVVMNLYRQALLERRSEHWPQYNYKLSRIWAEFDEKYTNYHEEHEHIAPPTTLHHYHQQVPVVVDANTPLVRGQLLLSLIHI